MAKCMVLSCKNSGTIPGLSYFRLSAKRHDDWMRALGRNPLVEHLGTSNRVCSEHFLEEDIIIKKNRIHLREGVVPRVKLGIQRPLSQIQLKDFKERSVDEAATSYQSRKTHAADGDNKENVPCQTVEDNLPSERFDDMSSSESTITCESPVTSTPHTFDVFEILVFFYLLFSIWLWLEMRTISQQQERKAMTPITALKRKADDMSSSSDSEGFRGEIKKNRRDIKIYHNYSVSPKDIVEKLKKVNLVKTCVQQKLRTAKRKIIRLSGKVTSMKQIMLSLSKKRLLSEEALSTLEKTHSGIPLTLLRRAIQNSSKTNGKKQGRQKIAPELRSFAMTLQFYSSKAYNYVRKTFNLALPAPSTIRGWMSNITCEPGFSEASFNSLKSIVSENNELRKGTVCSLMLDEMAIKKQIEIKGNKVWGYEDLGTELSDDSLKCATEALVLMVVSVNGSWKLPIAYFLISSLTGTEKANIVVEALKKLHSIGVIITSVTCDGPTAHFKMARQLGAQIDDFTNLQPFFKHPVDDSKIYIIFDACHMVKLFRNNWARCRIFVDGSGAAIDFSLIQKLHSVQESEFCRFGNKLRKSHIDWQKQKMKVNLAVQTISASVADALHFLMTDIKHPDFQDAEATIEFIRTIDILFDLLNSRNPYGKGYKTPLRVNSEHFWRPLLENGIKYLTSLKTEDGVSLIHSKNKTPFRGMVITITSVLGIYDEFVKAENSLLNYMLTYKFSQDHLELFFCCMRGKNGWNNNPTAHQFYYTYKRLVLRHDISNLKGNCEELEYTNILTTTQTKNNIRPLISIDDISVIKKYNIDIDDMIIEEDDLNCTKLVSLLPDSTMLTENVVTYISGFVVKSVKKCTKCTVCLSTLEDIENSSKDDNCFKLLNRKNRGGLIKPSKNVVSVCLYTEKKIRQILGVTNNFMPPETNFINIFVEELAKSLFQMNIFTDLDEHVFDSSFFNANHKLKLLRLICLIYSKIRFFNIAKSQTESLRGDLIRKKLTRLVLFSHQ